MVALGCEGGMGSDCQMDTISVWKVLELDGGDGYTTLWMYLMHWN